MSVTADATGSSEAGTVAWAQAWQQALYGAAGFYRGDGPGAHFTTATHGGFGVVLAGALADLARREGLTGIVDIGSGRGELLTHLHRVDPGLRLTGVDIVERPADLPEPITWLQADGGLTFPDQLRGVTDALVVAHEWLDVVPCAVAEAGPDGVLRVVQVDPATGVERLGDAIAGADLDWVDTHWGPVQPGDRVEIGRSRDVAWAELLSRIDSGVALAIDYGHRRGERPRSGTLTAYRHGAQVNPVPDGRCDITAHVAVDSLDHDDLRTQRQALHDLGVTGHRPDDALLATDPTAYVMALSRATHEAMLVAVGGFGDFWWVTARRAPVG